MRINEPPLKFLDKMNSKSLAFILPMLVSRKIAGFDEHARHGPLEPSASAQSRLVKPGLGNGPCVHHQPAVVPQQSRYDDRASERCPQEESSRAQATPKERSRPSEGLPWSWQL